MLATPVVLSVGLVVLRTVVGPNRGNVDLLGEWSLGFAALAAAFIADDATLEAAPATPVGARARLAARVALVGPVVVAGWLLVLLAYDAVSPAAVTADIADRVRTGVGLAAAALALAALGGKVRGVASPGVVGVGVMSVLAVVHRSAPETWLAALPPPTVLWPVTVVLAIATTVFSGREPAR